MKVQDVLQWPPFAWPAKFCVCFLALGSAVERRVKAVTGWHDCAEAKDIVSSPHWPSKGLFSQPYVGKWETAGKMMDEQVGEDSRRKFTCKMENQCGL